MQWTLKQIGWRGLLIRTGLLTTLWVVVAFVFATQIYLTTRGEPLDITWTVAAARSFRDWFPWILLSPIAVLLASRFRFDRNVWRRSLIMHLLACCVFALAYEGLVILVYPMPRFSTAGFGGGVRIFSPPPGLPRFTGSAQRAGPPVHVFQIHSNTFNDAKHFGFRADPRPIPADSNIMTIVRGKLPPLHVSGPVLSPNPSFVPPHARLGFPFTSGWTQLLHMAVMKTQFTVPIYWCIVCICWVFNHIQETGERERRTLELEARLTQANLQTLKMQLQPHFLFNTLNAISSLIHENPKVADDMVGSLSQFLRTTLEVSAKNEVPLRTELEFVERYLEIQQTRFGDRLQICRQVDPVTLGALVPPLILQPLVENAIRYGIESRETGGTVTIRALQDGNVLRLEISDDGEGLRAGQLLRTGNGVGLSNTKARLQELYGDQHQFKLTANHPVGACVRIEIPFRLSQPETKEGS